jgi:ABC-type tungstate transport system substrate-binding protein
MTDLQLFIIGCVLFMPVILVMVTSIIEIQKPKTKNSSKSIGYYVNQIGLSVILIGVFVLFGIIIFKY